MAYSWISTVICLEDSVLLSRYWRTSLLIALSFTSSACSSALFAVANGPAYWSPVHHQLDIPYGRDPRQRLDVYSPPKGTHLPVIVFWYGGAWTDGIKSNYRFVGTALAEQGFVAVVPDYRLYPTAIFPTFIEDGAQAVSWVERNAESFGGDPERIVLMGHSAGAHLAAMLALEPRYLTAAGVKRAHVVALVGLSGPYQLEPDTDELHAVFAPPFSEADWQPLQHVNSAGPPTLLLHGLADHRVLPIQTYAFRDALTAQGVPVETELYAGRDHADTVAGFSIFRRRSISTLQDVTRFIHKVTEREIGRASCRERV